MGDGRVRSPSGPSALVALNLQPDRKTGRLGDATLPVPTPLEFNPAVFLPRSAWEKKDLTPRQGGLRPMGPSRR
jgi:hypothetical protein